MFPNRRLEQRQNKQNVLTPKCLQFIQHANNSATNANEFMSLVLDIHVCYLRQTTDPHMFQSSQADWNNLIDHFDVRNELTQFFPS